MDGHDVSEQEAAALKLQAHYRGMRARYELQKKREDAYKARSQAAIVLQSNYRGYRGRREYKRIREERRSEDEEKQEEDEEADAAEMRTDDVDGVETNVAVDGRVESHERAEHEEADKYMRDEIARERENDEFVHQDKSGKIDDDVYRLDEESDEDQKREGDRHEEVEQLQEERMETQRQESARRGAERMEAEELEVKRLRQKKALKQEAERLKAERVEAQRLEAEKVKFERLATQRRETERLEAETHREAQRQELLRLKPERHSLEEEKVEVKAEMVETERMNSERQESPRHNETMKWRRRREEAAAVTIQKHYRGYVARRDYPKYEAKGVKHAMPRCVSPPMLSQQIVDEVTRAMAIIMNHSAGTLTKQQIERTDTLKNRPVRQLQRWRQPQKPTVVEMEDERTEDTPTEGYAKTKSKMQRKQESIWSLKEPSLRPHPLKKTTNYLRAYLRTVGRPMKASANIRLRFKNNPKQQPPELTDIWDIKTKRESVGHSEDGRGTYKYSSTASFTGTALPAIDSQFLAYRHSVPAEPWQTSSQSLPYSYGSMTSSYSNAVMSDWTISSPSLQHMQSYTAESDMSTWTGGSSVNDLLSSKGDFSQSEVYHAVSGNLPSSLVGRSDRPIHKVGNRHRLEPLQRTKESWGARKLQAKQTSSVGYAARYKGVADAHR